MVMFPEFVKLMQLVHVVRLVLVIAGWSFLSLFEPPHEKTNNLHRRKQRRRSASR